MTSRDLKYYEHAFTHLRRDHKKGGAPHKPILLLSILDAFNYNLISENRIYVTPELISFFSTNWAAYVETEHDKRFTLPFFHMQTEPFWQLEANEGCEMWVQSKAAMRSLGNLQSAVKYAQIDKELFDLLSNSVSREVIRQIILETYFPNTKGKSQAEDSLVFIDDLTNQMVQESPIEYSAKVRALKATLSETEFEEEIILRGSLFKREVPKKYKYTCCVSELKIDVSFNATTLIEACHIEPFSISYIDTISNGIALSPTLHTAFDRGLFTISENYEIIVSSKFTESKSVHGLKQFHGKKILLPALQSHYPDVDRIRWHQINKFEQ